MIIGIPVTLFSLAGYVFAAHHWLKIPFRLSPLFCSCSLMILLFWAALAQLLLPITIILTCCGSILSLFMLIFRIRGKNLLTKKTDNHPGDSLRILSGLVILSLLCALVGRLSVIDDYAYWAIIGKSIAMFNGLPTAETTIFARHLTYTPGLALFQYYFFSTFSGYNLPVAYFAQNLFLCSLLFALSNGQSRTASLSLIGAAVILLVLFSGSVFQKLRVDHFLSVSACVALWIQIRNRFTLPRFAVIASIIGSLYLIKEVGFILAVTLLLGVLLDLIFVGDIPAKEKKTALFLCLGLFLYLVMQKIVWDSHCTAFGFNQFHSSISLESVGAALNLTGGSNGSQGFFIFMRDILIGPADRLKLPYLFWYLLLGILWYQTLKGSESTERRRYYRLFSIILPLFLLYLTMNYVMQVVIFGLGTTKETTTSLERYVNIYFFWFILFTVETSLARKFSAQKGKKSRWPAVIVTVAALLVAGSSLPHSKKKYERELDTLIPELRSRIEAGSRICLTPGNIEDHYLGFRLLYNLLPDKINVDSFPGESERKDLEEKLLKCDYLLVYLPNKKTRRIFSPWTKDKIEHQSLFKVSSRAEGAEQVSLQRVF